MEEAKIMPRFSVVMPAYRAGRYMAQAVRSLQNQTAQDWELWIVEDCSGDDTLSLAQRLAAEDARIHVIANEENMGAARSRNAALDRCRGAYIAFLDSDDLWLPEKLERQLELLEKTGAALAYSSYAIIDAHDQPSRPEYIVPERVGFAQLLKENVIGCSTVLLRRECLENRRFTTDFYHEDYILWLDLLRSGVQAVGCTAVLVKWRCAENSRSFNKAQAAKNRWKIYRHYLGLPLGKSCGLFLQYTLAGVKKYLR